MKRIVLIYGCISGLILAIWMITFTSLGKMEDFDKGMIYGYASMLIAFAFVYVGINKYKVQVLQGPITFKQGFMTGLYITLIAATFYVAAWMFVYYTMAPDFMEKYMAYSVNKMKSANMSQVEIDKKVQEMKSFAEMYKNPLVSIFFTYFEVLPVGLLISAISAYIHKIRK